VTRLGALVGVALLAVATRVRADCPGSDSALRLPAACVGETTSGAATFCFSSDCLDGGVVLAFDPPAAPFSVTAIHVDGVLGSHPAAFPQLLLPGDRIVADISVTLPASGEVSGRFAWVLPTQEDAEDGVCAAQAEAVAPVCATGDACGEMCVAGTCVPVTPGGACEDGDPCTIGDQCVEGVCRPGPRLECPSNACFVGTCVAGACGSVPVDCDDERAADELDAAGEALAGKADTGAAPAVAGFAPSVAQQRARASRSRGCCARPRRCARSSPFSRRHRPAASSNRRRHARSGVVGGSCSAARKPLKATSDACSVCRKRLLASVLAGSPGPDDRAR